MDPMCLSLVQQFLDNTSSSLANQFRHKYEPRRTTVNYEEVLLKWREDQLAKSLVHQHLKTVSSTQADNFRVKFQPEVTRLQIVKAQSKWTEDQLVRGLVFEHLKKVAPTLAVEFQNKHAIAVKMIPKKLIKLIDKTLPNLAVKERTRQNAEEEGETQQILPRNRTIVNTFTREELLRIKRAIAMKEDVGAVAKELGRSYGSVAEKIRRVQATNASMKSGKYSAEEERKIRLAVEKNEHYKTVAKELNRAPHRVQSLMYKIANDPTYRMGGATRRTGFSVEEDLLILDEVISGMDVTKLSCVGRLPTLIVTKIAKETERTQTTITHRWDQILSYLLQHYAGTAGFRIEVMLTNLIAEKFSDHQGISWSEILNQHEEFLGHTASSLSKVFQKVQYMAKRAKGGTYPVSLQEVADFAAATYQSGKEIKEPPAKAAHREKIISHFKRRVAELGINVVL